MRLEEQVVSLELAKRLKELGVKQESHFEWEYNPEKGREWEHRLLQPHDDRYKFHQHCAAFTVAELGELLPYEPNHKYFSTNNGTKERWICWEWVGGYQHHYEDTTGSDTEADARAKMLIHLIENGIVKP